ncbi:MAG TPA: trigger factor [Blastocatellia bacterium]|nr:trigger factor [Blastocatellia bacterium]
MKVDIDELSSIQRKVNIELPADRVANEFARAYKNLGQRVHVRGFRTGKIPRKVLQGIYGEDIKGEVRSHLVEECLAEVVKDRGLQIVSRPEVEANEIKEDDGFSFSAVFEVKPAIELKDYLGVEVEKAKIAVSEEQVDEALKRLQEGHARLELVEGRDIVQKGDFVTVDFEGTIAGKRFAGGKGENYVLEVGAGHTLPQFEEAVVGLQLGQQQIIPVTYPDNYPNAEIAGKAVEFALTVREIKHKVLPVLDDDFAKDHGEHGSLAELRSAIRKRLEDELKHYQDEDLKEKIISRLIEVHTFVAPPSMIDRQTRYLMERYQSQMAGRSGAEDDQAPPMEEARKSLEARAARQVQATLLVEKIAQAESIEVSDKELQERVDNLARGAGDRGKSVREYYSRPDARDDLRAQMAFDRTLSFLLERAKIKEVEPPASTVDAAAEKS